MHIINRLLIVVLLLLYSSEIVLFLSNILIIMHLFILFDISPFCWYFPYHGKWAGTQACRGSRSSFMQSFVALWQVMRVLLWYVALGGMNDSCFSCCFICCYYLRCWIKSWSLWKYLLLSYTKLKLFLLNKRSLVN